MKRFVKCFFELLTQALVSAVGNGAGRKDVKCACGRLEAVFGGEMAAAKIQTVKGLRVEIFSRPMRKNTTRPLSLDSRNGRRTGIVFRNWVWYNFSQNKPKNWDLTGDFNDK